MEIEVGYRLGILVDDQVIIDLKAVEQVLPIHQAQIMTYLKLSQETLGLLINFNVPLVKNGIKRVAMNQPRVATPKTSTSPALANFASWHFKFP